MPNLELFRPAEEWFEKNKKMLEQKYPGKYICIDAGSLRYCVDENYDKAMEHWERPISTNGLHIFGTWLKT